MRVNISVPFDIEDISRLVVFAERCRLKPTKLVEMAVRHYLSPGGAAVRHLPYSAPRRTEPDEH